MSSANTVLKAARGGRVPDKGPSAGGGYSGGCDLGPRPPTEHWGEWFPESQQSQGWEEGDGPVRQEE